MKSRKTKSRCFPVKGQIQESDFAYDEVSQSDFAYHQALYPKP